MYAMGGRDCKGGEVRPRHPDAFSVSWSCAGWLPRAAVITAITTLRCLPHGDHERPPPPLNKSLSFCPLASQTLGRYQC